MPLKKQHFFASLLVLALCLVTANGIIAYLTRHSLPRRFLATIAGASGAPIVALGNSLLVVGLDVTEFNSLMDFKGPGNEAVNLAMGSTNPVEHLLFLRYALSHNLHPQLIIYGFLDTQLTDPVVLSNSEIIGNHDVLYYLEPEYARRFYQLSLRDSAEFEVVRRADMLADRSAVWAKVELFRRRLAAQGMPPVQKNRFGRVSDFSLLESQDADAFASQLAAASRNPFTSPVQEILRYASRSGARVVFIEMPMPSRHRRLFYDTNSWMRYRAHLRLLASANAAGYIDASHWITDDALFSDHIHLNSAGAVVFTRQLAMAIREADLMRRAETSVSSSSVRRLP